MSACPQCGHVPPTPRRLRSHKGVTYRDNCFYVNGQPYATVACAISNNTSAGLRDEDFAALLDLKANPYEPMPTLESVLDSWADECTYITHDARYADLCARLRAAFPHIESHLSPQFTAAEHIAALVKMGAKEYTGEGVLLRAAGWMKTVDRDSRVVILPPEVSK